MKAARATKRAERAAEKASAPAPKKKRRTRAPDAKIPADVTAIDDAPSLVRMAGAKRRAQAAELTSEEFEEMWKTRKVGGPHPLK